MMNRHVDAGFMTVEVKLGLVRHRVFADGSEFLVRREPGNWYRIEGLPGSEAGRVRYSSWTDRLRIERPEAEVRIQFRWRGTTFLWAGRSYRIRSAWWNPILIEERGRVAIRGRTTWSGVRLEVFDPLLEPIARELAIGLAIRYVAFSDAFMAAIH